MNFQSSNAPRSSGSNCKPNLQVLGRELLLHLAEHLCTSYLAGDKVNHICPFWYTMAIFGPVKVHHQVTSTSYLAGDKVNRT